MEPEYTETRKPENGLTEEMDNLPIIKKGVEVLPFSAVPLILGFILLTAGILLGIIHLSQGESKPDEKIEKVEIGPESGPALQALKDLKNHNKSTQRFIPQFFSQSNITTQILTEGQYTELTYTTGKNTVIIQTDPTGTLHYAQINGNSIGKRKTPTVNQVKPKKETKPFFLWGAFALFILGFLIPLKSVIHAKTIAYELRGHTLNEKSGILIRKGRNVNLIKYEDHNLRANLFEQMFKCGTVIVESDDKDTPILPIMKIKGHTDFGDEIYKRAMAARGKHVRRVEYGN